MCPSGPAVRQVLEGHEARVAETRGWHQERCVSSPLLQLWRTRLFTPRWDFFGRVTFYRPSEALQLGDDVNEHERETRRRRERKRPFPLASQPPPSARDPEARKQLVAALTCRLLWRRQRPGEWPARAAPMTVVMAQPGSNGRGPLSVSPRDFPVSNGRRLGTSCARACGLRFEGARARPGEQGPGSAQGAFPVRRQRREPENRQPCVAGQPLAFLKLHSAGSWTHGFCPGRSRGDAACCGFWRQRLPRSTCHLRTRNEGARNLCRGSRPPPLWRACCKAYTTSCSRPTQPRPPQLCSSALQCAPLPAWPPPRIWVRDAPRCLLVLPQHSMAPRIISALHRPSPGPQPVCACSRGWVAGPRVETWGPTAPVPSPAPSLSYGAPLPTGHGHSHIHSHNRSRSHSLIHSHSLSIAAAVSVTAAVTGSVTVTA